MHPLIRAVFGATVVLPLALIGASAHARNYDCSKPGNANKAVCKSVGKPAAPAATKPAAPKAATSAPVATATPAIRHYDCTKLGNRFRKECRAQAATTPSKAAAAPARPPVPAAAQGAGSGPQGATAKCKDGSYSHAAHHSGACSHHGGVAQFY
jgi:hypothetical protein